MNHKKQNSACLYYTFLYRFFTYSKITSEEYNIQDILVTWN